MTLFIIKILALFILTAITLALQEESKRAFGGVPVRTEPTMENMTFHGIYQLSGAILIIVAIVVMKIVENNMNSGG